jgi:hypothetical protein
MLLMWLFDRGRGRLPAPHWSWSTDVRYDAPHINPENNAARYDKHEVETTKARMMRAARKHGLELDQATAV